MRNLITICLVCMVGLTQAAVTFDFDTLSDGASTSSYTNSEYLDDGYSSVKDYI